MSVPLKPAGTSAVDAAAHVVEAQQGEGAVQQVYESISGYNPTSFPCIWCEGKGTILDSDVVCRTCSGTGRVKEPPYTLWSPTQGWWSHSDGTTIVYEAKVDAEGVLRGLLRLWPDDKWCLREYIPEEHR